MVSSLAVSVSVSGFDSLQKLFCICENRVACSSRSRSLSITSFSFIPPIRS